MSEDTQRPQGSSRWWLNPALARLAFGASTHGMSQHASVSIAEAMAHALAQGERLELDLADAAQRDFGEYELVERIGQGGMGMVFRARQRGLDREVAIKLLSAGQWAPEDLVESLRREAQHAARLQHPNIVIVHGIGEHAGLVYYAMQLVRGHSLSQRLDAEGPMPPRDAARLLRTIAEAVDYAHHLGVLHLDLKPGNLLIDVDGVPRISDFGLARPLNQVLEYRHVSGTPSYMAPEQARPDGGPLSPATDVWALGAVLYEMLTGHAPFESDDPARTLQLLQEGTVRRLSRLAPVPADLEAICLHCLRRDPRQRYPSARALADDLGRFLEGRSVSVRPLDALQRTLRWTRREPKLAASALIATSVLALGMCTSLWLWRDAEKSARQAREVNRFLNDDVLAAADPYLEAGQDPSRVTVPMLLANAEAKLDRGAVDQPAVRAQAGLTIGRAYFGLGLWTRARQRLESARRDAITALGRDAPLTLDIEEQLGSTATFDGHYREAAAVYGHLLPARRAQSGPRSPATIRALRGLALLLYETDQFERSTKVYEEARAAAVLNAPDQLPDIDWTLSDLYTEVNRWDDAERLLRNALIRSRRQLGAHHPQYLWETLSLVDMLNMRARWDEAEALAVEDRELLSAVVGAEHPKVATATHYLGQIKLERGQPQQALPLLREALAARTSAHGESHKWSQYTMNRVGQAYIALGRPREGIAMLEHALELATRAGRRDQAYVLLIFDNLARGYMAIDDPDRAEALLDEALVYARRSLPANNVRRGMLERSLGELRAMQGRPAEAIEHYAYAERIFRGMRPDHPWVLDLQARIGALQAAGGVASNPHVVRAKPQAIRR
jgi:serine/threonine protein kinase